MIILLAITFYLLSVLLIIRLAKRHYRSIYQDITEMKIIQSEFMHLNNALENRVIERTMVLKDTNEQLVKEIEKRKLIEENATFMANHDFLTGLPNRRYFIEAFDRVVQNNEQAALVYIDLDDFKSINDTLGHVMGDAVLIEVAYRINRLIQAPNLLARIGGDELLILMEDFTTLKELELLLDDILISFIQPFELENDTRNVSASMGVAMYPKDGRDFVTLMKHADIALYESKHYGKNQYIFCNDALKEKVHESYRIELALEQAVAGGEIITYYQPKVNLSSGEITGFEALARWCNGDHGIISPAVFIPIAEKTGVICEIGSHILRTACRQIKHWVDEGYLDWHMSVNISVTQIETVGFIEEIKTILDEVQLAPEYLELEITESLLLKNDAVMIQKLFELKKMGIRISMDDFGTEYSSLKYMKFLPIDKVKIDREFVSQININFKDEEIIKSTIQLIKKLGLEVVAEGVETEEQAQFLCDYGCEEVQGYYYYKPMEANALNRTIIETSHPMSFDCQMLPLS